jgi:16S rRNA (cytosine1402-N4)-methyltransferase
LEGPVDHIPVLEDEVVGMLATPGARHLLDGTVGLGGHAAALLGRAAPDAHLVGVDLDRASLARARERLAPFGERVHLFQASYLDLPERAAEAGCLPADAVLLDLGLSSALLEGSGRGFTFQKDEPLDMRFDVNGRRPADELVNHASEEDLARILRSFGEEPGARRIARAVVSRRETSPLRSTGDLVAAVRDAMGGRSLPRTLARVFQAVRIAVNDELEVLGRAIPRLVECLRPGGRMGVISYHSLEDRVAKQALRRLEGRCVCPPGLPVCACSPERRLRAVGRAVRPAAAEVQRNPRCRSAVLRVVERVAAPALEAGVTA